MQKRVFDTGFDIVVGYVGSHARTKAGHDVPVADINQDTSNKRPLSAETRFHRMDRTNPVPEDAVPVRALAQNESTT